MVLDFSWKLEQAQEEIAFDEDVAEFVISDSSTVNMPEEIDVRFSKALWTIVEILNKRYSEKLESKFNLYNWIEHNPNDEVSYFLNEASSNCMNYSEMKAIWKIMVYFGDKGFILAVTQQGRGFDAEKIYLNKIKSNEGAGFTFYDECSSKIFFDKKNSSRAVYMQYVL